MHAAIVLYKNLNVNLSVKLLFTVANPAAAGAAGAQSPHNPLLVLPEFGGESDETTKIWYQCFNLLLTKYAWSEQERCIRLGFNCVGAADTWYATLPQQTRDTWANLRPAFEQMFLNMEPPLITESCLQARTLQPGEGIDNYYSSILQMGATLERNPDQLSTQFLSGLTES